LVYELPDYGKVHAEVYAEEYILVPSRRSNSPRGDGPNLAGGAYAEGRESLPPSDGGPKGKRLSSRKPSSEPERPPGMPGFMAKGSCDVIEARRMPKAARPNSDSSLIAVGSAPKVEPNPDAPEEPPGLGPDEN